MNKLYTTILTFSMLLLSLTLTAQDNESEVNYIFKKTTELKGFGTVEMKLSQIIDRDDPAEDEIGLLIGGTGGITINKHLIFGVGGYGIVTKTTIQGVNPAKPLRMYGGYGGLLLGINLFPREVVHLSFPVLLGVGNIDLVDETYFDISNDADFTVERSAFFVAEPGAVIEVNVTPFFHLGVGASYRFIDGLDMVNLSSSDLTNWSGNLILKFGGF
jgi:hypothetical protein